MLTRHSIRQRLDAIADEILESPNMYEELYSRLFSLRVKQWVRRCSHIDATSIEAVASEYPDYRSDLDLNAEEATGAEVPAILLTRDTRPLFNPDWDVSY